MNKTLKIAIKYTTLITGSFLFLYSINISDVPYSLITSMILLSLASEMLVE